MTNVITAEFNGTHIDIIDHAGQRWITAAQLGLALGYNDANAGTGVTNLYNRHADEFTDADTLTIKLMANPIGGNPTTRIFSASGCNLLSFFANTTRAKQFRAWAKQALVGQASEPVDSAGVDAKLGRMARAMESMAHHMGTLAQGTGAVQAQLQLTGKYISLLELNQKGQAKITREIEAEALRLAAQGMAFASIARILRVSRPAVSALVNGRYNFAAAEAVRPTLAQPGDVQAAIDARLDRERESLLHRLGALNALAVPAGAAQ